jgi:dipeptidyl aminopeptidase/acylaminoacyl peptidase
VLEDVRRIDDRGYTQYAMRYDSDGLTITGLINIPPGFGPFPVAICLHGYAAQWVYYPGYDSARFCDWLAEYNYITIMPDYRNYGNSDQGPNPFRVGYAVDILNLIAQVGSLPSAAPEQIGLFGHSLGGEVAMWPMVISEEVDAIVLYASMSGDVARNWQHRWAAYPIQRDAMNATAAIYGRPEDNPQGYARVSPANYLERVRMPVHIHHGKLDDTVPFWWSEELAGQLAEAGKEVVFYEYEGEGHGFTGANFPRLMERTLALFEAHVRQNTNTPGR